jgi:methionine synthase I (cobalamin-dependent)
MPIRQDGGFLYPVDPVEFNRVTPQLISEGVRLIGGCCGTTPAHVAAIASAIARCE